MHRNSTRLPRLRSKESHTAKVSSYFKTYSVKNNGSSCSGEKFSSCHTQNHGACLLSRWSPQATQCGKTLTGNPKEYQDASKLGHFLRAGGRGFPPVTMCMTPGYFHRKIWENWTKRTSEPFKPPSKRELASQLASLMAERQIGHRKSRSVPFARFPVSDVPVL